MKKMMLFILVMLISILMLGCDSQTIYIRNAKVSGSMDNPPVYVTMDSTKNLIRISPRFSVNQKKRLTGTIDPAKSGNLQWSLPDNTIGFGADFWLGRYSSLTVGGNYGIVDGYDSWNGSVGIGFHNADPASGLRLDAGLCLSRLRYDAYTVVVTTLDYFGFGRSSETANYHDRGIDDYAFDFYASLTLNTKSRRLPVNLFLNTCFLRQTLANYRPTTRSETWLEEPLYTTDIGKNATYRVMFLSLTPGLAFNLGTRYMLLVGGRIVTPLGKDLNPKPIISPFMQVDFALR